MSLRSHRREPDAAAIAQTPLPSWRREERMKIPPCRDGSRLKSPIECKRRFSILEKSRTKREGRLDQLSKSEYLLRFPAAPNYRVDCKRRLAPLLWDQPTLIRGPVLCRQHRQQ